MADLVFSLTHFAQRNLKPGHSDRIFLGPLKAFHGREKHTEADWKALIEKLRRQPVKPR